MQKRRELAVRHQLEEEFELSLVRRRDNRVGPLDQPFRRRHTQRRVLAGHEMEGAAGVDVDAPQARRDFLCA